jgi:RNA polymerase sigma-70 factor, ECF subfamily
VEQELLRQAQNGDYDAFEQLHGLLQGPITRFVRRLIGPGQEVEDVVQDTFIAFYTNMHRIQPVENLRPYIFRIARNNCYDILRRQGRYEHLSLDDEPVSVRVSFEHSNRHQPSTEDATHWLLLHLEVQEAMENLPELQRQALILYAEEDMSYAEIAEIMDVSVGTIKSRLFHAKKNLRRLVSPATLRAIKGEFEDVDRSRSLHGQQEEETEDQVALLPAANDS